MKIKEIIEIIENIAPLSYQESYDNSGLIVGNPKDEVSAVLLSLDVTETVVDEAVKNNCQLIIAHHPIVFKGLKKLNGKNYVERTVIKAIQKGVAIYAAHTNLDNVFQDGVNQKFGQKLGLRNMRILQPKSQILSKLSIYTPEEHVEELKDAMFRAGAGHIGQYSECSYTGKGLGTFKPEQGANPYDGEIGIRKTVNECKLEVILPNYLINSVLSAAKDVHPYEEVAYECLQLNHDNAYVGSGVIGELEQAMSESQFLALVKEKFKTGVIRYTSVEREIRKIAVCGGVGSFLIESAKRQGADAYVTADVKYHEFFDAENELMICDIGHYESEISTLEIFYDKIKEKLPNFAVIFCQLTTNPILYYT